MALWAVIARPLRHCLRYVPCRLGAGEPDTLDRTRKTFIEIRLVYRSGKVRAKSAGKYLSPAEVCDLLKGVVVVGCWAATWKVDTSMMYHLVKSQSVIKLYIFYNMLEVGDRLFSAFGQDTIDALLWTATEPRTRSRSTRAKHLGTLPHLLFALAYVCILSVIVTHVPPEFLSSSAPMQVRLGPLCTLTVRLWRSTSIAQYTGIVPSYDVERGHQQQQQSPSHHHDVQQRE